MVLGRLGRGARLVGSRARLPTGRFGVGAVVLAAVVLALLAAMALGLDPLASLAVFTALLAGDALLSGAILVVAGVVGLAAAFGSRVVGASRRTILALGAGGAAAGGAVATATMGVPAAFPTAGGIAALVGSGLVALAVGNPFLIAIIGGAGVLFLVDPLSKRGGFFKSLSWAVQLAVAAGIGYVTVVYLAPTLDTLLSVAPAIGGAYRG